MNKQSLFSLLDWPYIYRLSQSILAPGAEESITRKLSELSARFPLGGRVLDLGCGPSSWLWRVNIHPVGLDLSVPYIRAFRDHGELAVTGSADALPFRDGCFDSVWTIGVFHHLPDAVVCRTIEEMLRVCRVGGLVAILDAVLPVSAWTRPIAYLLRRLDRGGYVREQSHLLSLIPSLGTWSRERYSYTYLGHELIGCYLIRPPDSQILNN